eukprot:365229-Chlamydomonas_euryale.AAC.1
MSGIAVRWGLPARVPRVMVVAVTQAPKCATARREVLLRRCRGRVGRKYASCGQLTPVNPRKTSKRFPRVFARLCAGSSPEGFWSWVMCGEFARGVLVVGYARGVCQRGFGCGLCAGSLPQGFWLWVVHGEFARGVLVVGYARGICQRGFGCGLCGGSSPGWARGGFARAMLNHASPLLPPEPFVSG